MAQRVEKRILMLLQNSPYSEDGRVRREATALRAAGYAVTVICPRAKGQRRVMDFDGVRAYQYTQRSAGNGLLGYVVEYGYSLTAMLFLSLYVWLRRGFDVVHAHNPPDLLVLIGAFYKLLGKRFVFDHHDLAPEMYFARFSGKGNVLVHRLLIFFERLSCRWADHVLAANESYKRVEIERSGIPEDRISVVRNGPEPCHLAIVAPEASLLDARRTLIGFVGDMGFQDGVDYLLRALRHLTCQLGRSEWHCLLVGDGASLESLTRLSVELGIEQQVSVTGWLDYREVPRHLAAMDICVAPDPSNGYSDHSTIIKLMEYMAQAKAIVAFDLPEHRVTAGEAALYARPNDEADFARQIARLMDDPALGRSLGQLGRQRVINQLAWVHQQPRLLDAYARLFRRAPANKDKADCNDANYQLHTDERSRAVGVR